MDTALLKEELLKACPGLILAEHEPMSKHTSFRIGGNVALMAQVQSEEEFAAALRVSKGLDIEPYILGNGTNVLAEDGEIDRFVIVTAGGLNKLEQTGDCEITCGAGVPMARLAVFTANLGLTGLEFAHGIPGTVGGGMAMNAGAYGGEMKDVAVRTRYLTVEGVPGVLEGDAQELSYRHSAFSAGDKYVTEAVFALKPGNPDEIRAKMEELASKRRNSQPLELPSAGSTFKRPTGGFAAALIDQCGLKGYTVGGAQVSTKHAGFVVNIGGATCEDVVHLTDHIRETVKEETGIELELEVRRFG